MELSWQEQIAEAWLDRANQRRLPHAVMLIGPVGVGKRAAASWMAHQKLSKGRASSIPEYPYTWPEHADFRHLAPPEDKRSIGIEQVRELVTELTLTSYEGFGKVAVVEPANDMTVNAANSLLKTLEEPPGDALLILVADRVGKLPATIFSRCQRIDFPVPPATQALHWLDQYQAGGSWAEALRAAAGAPIGAIDAVDRLDISAALAQDLQVLGQGRGSPIEVAARWAKLDPDFILNWLSQQVKLAILASSGAAEQSSGLTIDHSVLHRMDRRNMFCYLDIINRLRGQPGGSWNVQLTFEGLLIDWAGGLRKVGY